MYKAIIFDMDGVLVNTTKYGFTSINKALSLYGVSMSKKEHKKYGGYSLKKRIPLYEKRFNIKINFEDFSNVFINIQLDLIKQDIKNSKSFIKNLFDTIKRRGLKIAVSTGAMRKKVIPILDGLGVMHFIDSLITSEDIIQHKPNPESYLKTIDKLGINTKEAIVIEDSPIGILSAKNAGIKVVGLKTKIFEYKEIENANIIIQDLEEILNII